MSLRLMYSPTLLGSIAQVLILNHLPSQDLLSGDITKNGKNPFLGQSLEDLVWGLVGLGLPNHSLTGRRRHRK